MNAAAAVHAVRAVDSMSAIRAEHDKHDQSTSGSEKSFSLPSYLPRISSFTSPLINFFSSLPISQLAGASNFYVRCFVVIYFACLHFEFHLHGTGRLFLDRSEKLHWRRILVTRVARASLAQSSSPKPLLITSTITCRTVTWKLNLTGQTSRSLRPTVVPSLASLQGQLRPEFAQGLVISSTL